MAHSATPDTDPADILRLAGLRGRRVGCWCPDGQPCHARVLAELAGATTG